MGGWATMIILRLPNVNTRLGWLAAFIRFISGHICGGLLKCTFPTFKILRRICKINRTLALIEQIKIERKRNTKFLAIENTNNGNYHSWISMVQHSWLFVMLSTNSCYCECEKGSFFGYTNKILTNRIARLHKTNIYIMVIHQIFPKTPLQAPICLVKLWAGAGRCREGKSFGRKGTC